MTTIRNLDGFEQETDIMMEYFVDHQNKLPKDDPEQAVIMDAYSQVSSHMKDKFSKYMPHIFHGVLEALDMEIKLVTHQNEDFVEMSQKKFAISVKNYFLQRFYLLIFLI